jgi:hypothetical protein
MPVVRRQRRAAPAAPLACNLGDFLRTVATPEPIRHRSLTSQQDRLIKIGARLASHGRYVAFQMAEVAVPRALLADILRLDRRAAAAARSRAGVRHRAITRRRQSHGRGAFG